MKRHNELEMCHFDRTLINSCANKLQIYKTGFNVTCFFHCCHTVCSSCQQQSDCMVLKLVSSCHDTWRYRGTKIYRDLFDTGIEILVLTILIKVLKASHNTSQICVSNDCIYNKHILPLQLPCERPPV